MNKNLLSGKKIFLTGGTSRLGAALVRLALREGAEVFFSYYQGEAAAKELEALGARSCRMNLLSGESLAKAAAWLEKQAGCLDGLVHNAAAVRDATLQTMTEEDWDRVMEADLKAPYVLTQKLLPLILKAPKPAKILFLTSRAAFRGSYGASNYAAAKAGLIGLVKSLAAELGSVPVLVNAVNPGFMISGMTQDLPESVKESQRRASPLEKFSDPEEVAAFMAYLLSGKSAQVSGQVFHWDARTLNF